MPTPFIHLSDQCEITDISDKFKSLPGKPEGKDFLRSILGEYSAERLEDFCLCGGNSSPLSFTLSKSCLGCNEAVAVRDYAGGAYLYLVRDTADAPITFKNQKSSISDEDVSAELIIGGRSANTNTFFKVCSRLLYRYSEAYTAKRDSEKNGGLSLECYPIILDTLMSLIYAISAVASGEILLDSSSHGTGVEISVSAETDIIPPFTGNCTDITLLSPYLRGSMIHLSKAMENAGKIGFSIHAVFSPTGTLRFTVSRLPGIIRAAEFKIPTENEEEAAILDGILRLVLSVKQQKDEQHQ